MYRQGNTLIQKSPGLSFWWPSPQQRRRRCSHQMPEDKNHSIFNHIKGQTFYVGGRTWDGGKNYYISMLLHLRAPFLLCERTQKHWNIIVSSHPFFPHHHVALGPLYRLRTSKMCVYKFGHHLRVLQGESEKISYDSCYVVFSALASADPISEILPILLSGSSGHKNFPQYHIQPSSLWWERGQDYRELQN